MKPFAKRIENEHEDEDEDEPKDELSPHPATLGWNCKVSFSIRPAVFLVGGGADTWNPTPEIKKNEKRFLLYQQPWFTLDQAF